MDKIPYNHGDMIIFVIRWFKKKKKRRLWWYDDGVLHMVKKLYQTWWQDDMVQMHMVNYDCGTGMGLIVRLRVLFF